MKKVTGAEWGDVMQVRDNRMEEFGKELGKLLEKHNLYTIPGENMYFFKDLNTNEFVGEASDLTPNFPIPNPSDRDLVDIKEEIPEQKTSYEENWQVTLSGHPLNIESFKKQLIELKELNYNQSSNWEYFMPSNYKIALKD